MLCSNKKNPFFLDCQSGFYAASYCVWDIFTALYVSARIGSSESEKFGSEIKSNFVF